MRRGSETKVAREMVSKSSVERYQLEIMQSTINRISKIPHLFTEELKNIERTDVNIKNFNSKRYAGKVYLKLGELETAISEFKEYVSNFLSNEQDWEIGT